MSSSFPPTPPSPADPSPVMRLRAEVPHWLPLALVCLVVGGAAAALWRANQSGESGGKPSGQPSRAEILAQQLSAADAKAKALRAEVDQLRAKLGGFEEAAAQEQNLSTQLNAALQDAREVACLTAVRGKGLVVELADAPLRVGPGEEQSPYLIHDVDLLQLANELRAAKAEAIAINGQRLTANSEIRCSGPVTRVNNTALVPPYRIAAIGDPKILKGALELPGGVLDILRPLEIQVTITMKDEVELPAADVTQSFKFLRSVAPEAVVRQDAQE